MKFKVKEGFSVSLNGKSYQSGDEIPFDDSVKNFIEEMDNKKVSNKQIEKDIDIKPKKKSKRAK